jgi:hypothetical protein
VTINPLAYAGDVINGLTIRGIPDGMGATRNEDGTITLLSSHEVPSYAPIAEHLRKQLQQGQARSRNFNY